MAIQQKHHVDAVGCHAFCSGLNFNILQIHSRYRQDCSECIEPTCTILATGLLT